MYLVIKHECKQGKKAHQTQQARHNSTKEKNMYGVKTCEIRRFKWEGDTTESL